jgi:hypothetical protein
MSLRSKEHEWGSPYQHSAQKNYIIYLRQYIKAPKFKRILLELCILVINSPRKFLKAKRTNNSVVYCIL